MNNVIDQIDLFSSDEEIKEQEELKKKLYSTKIMIPQYQPSEICPSLTECVDLTKYTQLIENINKSNVSEDEKQFLRFAAARHLKFTYSKVADYYTHATKEMQRLMEQSALVLIDIDNAIANGYVQLSTRLDDIMGDQDDE